MYQSLSGYMIWKVEVYLLLRGFLAEIDLLTASSLPVVAFTPKSLLLLLFSDLSPNAVDVFVIGFLTFWRLFRGESDLGWWYDDVETFWSGFGNCSETSSAPSSDSEFVAWLEVGSSVSIAIDELSL